MATSSIFMPNCYPEHTSVYVAESSAYSHWRGEIPEDVEKDMANAILNYLQLAITVGVYDRVVEAIVNDR